MRYPLIAIATLFLSAAVIAQNREEDVELKSGEIISAVVRDIHEEGIEIELAGVPMQISWKLLRAERFLDDRKHLVEEDDVESVRRFALWCYDYALDDELEEANELIVELGGQAIETDQDAEEVELQHPIAEANSESDAIIQRIAFSFDDDADFEQEVKEELKRFSVELVDHGADATLGIKDFKLEKVDGAEFFGAEMHAIFKASCRCQFVDALGNPIIESKTFDSGKQKSYKDSDDAKRMAREILANFVARWVSLKVQTQ